MLPNSLLGRKHEIEEIERVQDRRGLNIEMYSVFMSYGPGIRILYPQSAVKYMRGKLREVLDQYGEGQEGQEEC